MRQAYALVTPAFAEHGGFTFAGKLITPDDPETLGAFLRRLARPVDSAALAADDVELAEQLVEVGVVHRLVPALEHLTIDGRPDERAVIEHVWADRWTVTTAPRRLVVLGALGSDRWHETLSRLDASTPTLVLSTEDEGCWLGPHLGVARACPRCLLHRRLTRSASAIEPFAPTHRSLRTAMTVLANLLERDAWAPRELVHWVTEFDALRSTLLRSNACPGCFRPTEASLARATQHANETATALAQPDGPEPDLLIELDWLTVGPLAAMSPGYAITKGAYRDAIIELAGVFAVAIDGTERVVVQQPNAAFGSGFTRTRQRRVLFSESIERLSLIGMQVDVARTTAPALGDLAVSPRALIPPFLDGTGAPPDDAVTDWCWATSLATGASKLVPFDVMVAGRPRRPERARLTDEPFFTGGATHVSVRKAATHALFEVIERDAFMVAWYLRLPLPKLERLTLADEPEAARRWLESQGLEFTWYDLSIELSTPTVLTVAQARVARGDWAKGGVVLSACAAPTVAAAMARGVSEVLGQHSAVACTEGADDRTEAEWATTFRRYVTRDATDALAFLRAPTAAQTRSRDLDPARDPFDQLVAEFRAHGLEPFLKVLSLDEATKLGLFPVKVVVPGLVRPSPDRASTRVPLERLGRIAARWGVPLTFNDDEHPQA